MTDERKYVRVYYGDMIRDYPDVWADDAQLAAWLRMLSTADPMWPTPPEIPRSVKPRTLTALTGSTLVEPLPQHRFRMKGMETERKRRSDAARTAAALRWHGNGTAESMPKTKRAVNEQSTTGAETDDDDGRADLEAFLLLKRRAPTPKQRQLLDEVMKRHDLTGPAWAASLMLRNPDDPIGAVIEADRQWREKRIQDAQEAEAPKPRPRRSGGLPQSARDLLEEWQAVERERSEQAKEGAA
jgi:hypothetical protein